MLDAMLSAWVEECCDEQERQIITEKRTARLCPGYGDIPLALNVQLGMAAFLAEADRPPCEGGRALSPAEIDDRLDRHRPMPAKQKNADDVSACMHVNTESGEKDVTTATRKRDAPL